MGRLRNWILIFTSAFVLNFIWENIHSVLYVHYKFGPIAQVILLHATLVDASIITISIFTLTQFPKIRKRMPWVVVVWWLVLAILIEQWALATNRWAYTNAMPIIPVIYVGLTPTIQLALTGWVVYSLFCRNKNTI